MKFALKPLALVLATLPFTVQAQETKLSPMIVSAPKIDTNASSVNEASLVRLRAATGDTASLLQDIPGVSLYGAGGVSSLPVIHGLNDDRVKVLVDGMDITSACGNHMNPPLSYIDPSNVAKIDVIAGITPVSKGGDSIGGSIVVDSLSPKFAKPGEGTLLGGGLSAFYRNNGSASKVSTNLSAASENTSISVFGAYAKSGDYNAADNLRGKSDSIVRSSLYEARNDSITLAAQGGGNLFVVTVGEQRIPYQGFVNQYMDMTQNKASFINARYEGQFGWGKLEARVYDEKTRHSMNFLDDKTGNMPMETDGNNAGFLVKAEIALNQKDIVRLGTEYQRFRENDWWPAVAGSMMMGPNAFWNISNGQRDRSGIFAEWESALNTQWTSQLGVRYEQVKINAGQAVPYANAGMMNQPDWQVGAPNFNAADHKHDDNNLDLTAVVRFTPDATRTFEAGYARKNRSPNLYELYAWGRTTMDMQMNGWFGDGNGYVGNLNLKRETANTLSASASWHDAARTEWEFKATPYYTKVSNFIDVDRCAVLGAGAGIGACSVANLTATNTYPIYLQFANHSARLYGVDLSGHLPLGDTSWGRFVAKGVVSYVNGKNLDSGDRLFHMMPLNGKFSVEQQLGGWANAVEVQLVGAKDDVSSVRAEPTTPGYSLINLRTSYSWKQVRIDAGLDNLFNRMYYLPLGGTYLGERNAGGNTPRAWGDGVPGMGRSVYVGLSYKF